MRVYYSRGVVHSVNRHVLFLRNRKPLSFSSKNRHRHLSTCFRDAFEALKPGLISNYLLTPPQQNEAQSRKLDHTLKDYHEKGPMYGGCVVLDHGLLYTLNVWSRGKQLDEVEGNIRTRGKTKLTSFPRDHT